MRTPSCILTVTEGPCSCAALRHHDRAEVDSSGTRDKPRNLCVCVSDRLRDTSRNLCVLQDNTLPALPWHEACQRLHGEQKCGTRSCPGPGRHRVMEELFAYPTLGMWRKPSPYTVRSAGNRFRTGMGASSCASSGSGTSCSGSLGSSSPSSMSSGNMCGTGGSSSTWPPPTSSTAASVRSSGAGWQRCCLKSVPAVLRALARARTSDCSVGDQTMSDVGPSCCVVLHRGNG